jgi:hypothetical protein
MSRVQFAFGLVIVLALVLAAAYAVKRDADTMAVAPQGQTYVVTGYPTDGTDMAYMFPLSTTAHGTIKSAANGELLFVNTPVGKPFQKTKPIQATFYMNGTPFKRTYPNMQHNITVAAVPGGNATYSTQAALVIPLPADYVQAVRRAAATYPPGLSVLLQGVDESYPVLVSPQRT